MSTLPESLGEAVELFAASDLMRETLGEHIHACLLYTSAFRKRRRAQNVFLLVTSLFFYAWG